MLILALLRTHNANVAFIQYNFNNTIKFITYLYHIKNIRKSTIDKLSALFKKCTEITNGNQLFLNSNNKICYVVKFVKLLASKISFICYFRKGLFCYFHTNDIGPLLVRTKKDTPCGM